MFRVKATDSEYWVVDSAGSPITIGLVSHSEAAAIASEHNLRMNGEKLCIFCPQALNANDTTRPMCGGEQ